jgi:hypothetical protein
LVVGGGHSAFNAVLDLVTLQKSAPETDITWAVRRQTTVQMFGGGQEDALSERGSLGIRVQKAVQSGCLRFLTGVHVQRLEAASYGSEKMIHVIAANGPLGTFDEIISVTGYRPDLNMLSELRLSLDQNTEAASAIAPLIDPNVHSCGTVPPHGAEALKHPEQNFYIAGIKSYGRAPTFLMLTGYEQVRSIAAALMGDWESARQVMLTLPESGVCCGDGSEGDGCCGADPLTVTIQADGIWPD